MTIRALPAILLATVGTVALGQAGGGQAALKSRLESVRAPLFNSGRTVPGYTATYTVTPGQCTTRVEVSIPSHTFEGSSKAASQTVRELDWRSVTGVRVNGSYVWIAGPGMSSAEVSFFAGDAAGASALKAVMDGLRASCGSGPRDNGPGVIAAPSPPPSPPAPPPPPPPPTMRDNAARDFASAVSGLQVPIFNSGSRVSGTTARYVPSTTGCTTRLTVNIPAHSVNGRSIGASSIVREFDWSKGATYFADDDPNYLKIYSQKFPDGVQIYGGSANGTQRLMRAINALSQACGAAGPNRPAGLTERYSVDADILRTPQCRFRQVPELLLTDNTPPVVKTSRFQVLSREAPSNERINFAVGAQKGDSVASWRGVLGTSPRFVVAQDAFAQHHIVRATVSLDGQDSGLPVSVDQSKGFGNPWSSSISIVPDHVNSERDWLARIEFARTAVLRVYDESGTSYGPWTFDVSKLRYMPMALEGAGWTCG